MNIEKYALPHIQALSAYVPGDQPDDNSWIKLNTNENPYGPSPRVAPAVAAEMGNLERYPNPMSIPLRQAIARHYGLAQGSVIIGNGSDDVLNLLIRAFAGKGNPAGMTFPSYSLYPVLTSIQGTEITQIPFEADMQLPEAAIKAQRKGLFLLTSPNAPTGVAFTLNQLRSLIAGHDGIFVLDEAYAEFAEQTGLELLKEFPNLVITRTFSKAYALAGLRVGYGMASPEIIDILDRIRDSYNVNRLSQAGALAAFEDQAYYTDVIGRLKQNREDFEAQLKAWDWFYYPSQTNFVFLEPKNQAGERSASVAASLFSYLEANKILVRYFKGNALTERFLRISIGTENQMSQLIGVIDQWRQSA